MEATDLASTDSSDRLSPSGPNCHARLCDAIKSLAPLAIAPLNDTRTLSQRSLRERSGQSCWSSTLIWQQCWMRFRGSDGCINGIDAEIETTGVLSGAEHLPCSVTSNHNDASDAGCCRHRDSAKTLWNIGGRRAQDQTGSDESDCSHF